MLFMLLALAPFTTSAKVNVKKIYNTNWLNVETEHFNVVSNTNAKTALLISEELERYRYFVAEVLGVEQKPLREKVTVVLAKSDSTFKMFGIRDDFVGVYSNRHEQISIFANAARFSPSSSGRSSEGRQTILHELAHFITYNTTHDIAMPLWFSEGMSEYLATYVEKNKQIVLGSRNATGYWSPKTRRSGRLFDNLDVEALLKSDTLSKHNNNTLHAREINEFYAYSFGFVHYLAGHPARRIQAFKYLQLLKQGLQVDQAFNKAFAMSYTEMTSALKSYLNGKDAKKLSYDLGKNGVEFPEFRYEQRKLAPEEALSLIINRINSVGAPFVSAEDRKIMLKEAEDFHDAFSLEQNLLVHQ
ncbi:hypothetical protein SAMN02745866_01077 [Alteromonadaceae bacterium Bs31]|nr:hypothetical protein SAMN02745866_01077 [Alteromonadaceae bacterium Bs31]